MKANTDSALKPNSFRPAPESRTASPESPQCRSLPAACWHNRYKPWCGSNVTGHWIIFI
jgi:hypothetical protein